MSLSLMAQVWKLDLTPSVKFILLAYADGAHDWPPSIIDAALIAQKTGYREAHVRAIMYTLSANTTLLRMDV